MEHSQNVAETEKENNGEARTETVLPERAGRTERDAEIVTKIAKGSKTHREIATEHGLTRSGVSNIAAANRGLIEQKQAEFQLKVFEGVEKETEAMTKALVKTVKNDENKNQAQAFKGLTDAMGVTGKASHVHIGDVKNEVVDLSQHVHLSKGGDAAELAELREGFGLS